MSSPAVEVRGLVKRYGARTAVDGLDLRLERGQVLALLGPNGAGKTTTVEVCEGYRRPDGGVVRVLGGDPWHDAALLRPRVGVMLQGGGAYPGIRTAEMLRLVAACAAAPLDAGWLLDVLGLTPAAKVPYKRLSGGQQQRLALACAVVGRPELVFLDEPTAGLDPQGRRLVWELIGALRTDGVSVLLTTHLMDEADVLADQVMIIDAGRVLAEGSPQQLTGVEGGGQQLRFRATPGLAIDELTAVLPDGHWVDEPRAGRYRVHGPVDPHILAAVASWCAERDMLLDCLQVGHRSLEDVFLDLTGRELRS